MNNRYMSGEGANLSLGVRSKAEALSAAIYNKGLALAQAGDLTGAIQALDAAIEVNKRNVTAHNLLGLCYHATGRLGDALFHWLVSQSYQPNDNLAAGYIEDVRANQRAADRANHSIALYNSALDFFKGGSGDMAIIRLKKAVELNPVFVDGLCLLALGYLSIGKPQLAEPHVRKALQTDAFNPKALAYYAEIMGVTQQEPRRRGTGKPLLMDASGYSKPANRRNIVNDFHIAEIISFFVGVVIVAAVFWFLILPDRDDRLQKEVERLNDVITMTQQAGALALAQKDEDYKDVNNRLSAQEDEIAEQAGEIQLLEGLLKLYQGYEYYDAGEYLYAYSMAVEIVPDGFAPSQAQRHAELLHDSSAKIEAEYYALGKQAYDRGQFDDAKWNLGVARIYSVSDSPTADLMYYYLGRIAERGEDFAQAIIYYETVVRNYPGSSQASDSQTRLNRLKD